MALFRLDCDVRKSHKISLHTYTLNYIVAGTYSRVGSRIDTRAVCANVEQDGCESSRTHLYVMQ